jgi:6-phospho-3-hexuloisomerase
VIGFIPDERRLSGLFCGRFFLVTRLFRSRLQGIISELQSVLNEVDVRSVDELARALLRARKIFIYGQGRTGHVSRAFAVRLMHLGMNAYFVGETTTPPITRRDLCLVNSGTGLTRFAYHVAEAAKEAGARLATITAHPEARIAAMADIVVYIPAPTKGEVNRNTITSQPPGSLFEQATLLLMDTLVLVLMDRLHLTPKKLAKRHTNIE